MKLTRAIGTPGLLPGHMYADDVILHVQYFCDLQVVVKICESWAERNKMEWKTSNGKSQILLSPEGAAMFPTFAFATSQISTVEKEAYLGLVLKTKGYSGEGTTMRIRSAHRGLSQMKSAGIVSFGMSPQLSRIPLLSNLLSKFQYS